MRNLVFILVILFPLALLAQEENNYTQIKTFAVRDTVQVDSASINPIRFKIETLSGEKIDTSLYRMNFGTGQLFVKNKKQLHDSLRVFYVNYPPFLTQTYRPFDPSIIVENTNNMEKLYALSQGRERETFLPFDGLFASGSISRGITTGNNQNVVMDSELDLQISGSISPGVRLRASIQDANVPIQQAGYSQMLNEFDQVFIELYGENWNIRAGDVKLVQDESFFVSYTKQVQGLSVNATLNPEENSTHLFAAGALVKGVFARSEIQGQESNQGPYKLTGPNGELYVMLVAGSERVFVNGNLLERGEKKDYIIDYNSGEIIFNATFPITSEMRIVVEYQYSDRNYSRIVTTGGGKHQSENFEIGAFIYSENDLKNQPLQQNLTAAQAEILAQAGDDPSRMFAPNVRPTKFDKNKVLYAKKSVNGDSIFVYSIDPEASLFQVSFTEVGENKGDYVLANSSAITRVFEYIAPKNGVQQGNFAPMAQLFAPEKLQIAVVHGKYTPNEKTNLGFELAGSRKDLNLFSTEGDTNNDAFALRLKAHQRIATENNWNLNAFATVNYLQSAFESVEPLYAVEFARNWNLFFPKGNQSFLRTGLEFTNLSHGKATYSFQHLDYSKNFNGNRHLLKANFQFDRLQMALDGSFMTSESDSLHTRFLQFHSELTYKFGKAWTGGLFSLESNRQENTQTQQLSDFSQAFRNYEIFVGLGDPDAVYAKIGYRHRINDSLRNHQLAQVSRSDNYYLESQLIQHQNAQLSVYANYRTYKEITTTQELNSLNSHVFYHQSLFNQFLTLQTVFETKSGAVPRQEFTYVKVNPGQGQYTWIDYNENGTQELEEFELASFQDQAEFIRVFLPSRNYIHTNQNKFSQLVTLNFQAWHDASGFQKFLSHFYNQTSYLIDRKIENTGNSFLLNPFKHGGENELGLRSNFRNSLFFNRGKQHFSTTYNFISTEGKSLLSTGLQTHILRSHQLDFTHKIQESWLFQWQNQLNHTENMAENFSTHNYRIEGFSIFPKVSYLLSQQAQFNLYYQYEKEQNQINQQESLVRQKLGLSFNFSNAAKFTINGEFNYIYNRFEGHAFSPVAYQMLQGLQPDKNYTWNLLFRKKLTDYLDLNLSYFGRKSENSRAIHTGSVQLRAYF